MLTIHLTAADERPDAHQLEGQRLTSDHYTRLIRDSARVITAEGRLLLVYERNGVPLPVADDVLRTFRSSNLNPSSGLRAGLSADPLDTAGAPTGVMGFMPSGRGHRCRMTQLSLEHPEVFQALGPLARIVAARYRELAPEYWAEQHKFVSYVSSDFRLRDSPFTTVNINRSLRTRAHRDKGDFRGGLGVITVLGDGWTGCELVFPRWNVAVDLRQGGVLLCDVHEVHGNAPFVTRTGTRWSLIFYALERLDECGSLEKERVRAQRRER